MIINYEENKKKRKEIENSRLKEILAATNTTELVVEVRPEKNSGSNGIGTHDLCDTDAALYQLS